MTIVIKHGKAYVYTPYSPEFVRRIKNIGGARWTADERCWIIPADAVETCREIMMDVFGECDIPYAGKRLRVRVTVLKQIAEERAPVSYFGKNLASASGRDSGARVGEGVTVISGKVRSGGSRNRWETIIEEGTVMVIGGIPQALYERDRDAKDRWGAKLFLTEVIEDAPIDRDALKAEREKLMERVAEIDRLLGEGGTE